MHYSVIQLRSQEQVRFRYMLEGFDKTWTDASARAWLTIQTFPRDVINSALAAFEMSDPRQIAETSVEIIQRPSHFYRTAWFLGCCLLSLAAAVWEARIPHAPSKLPFSGGIDRAESAGARNARHSSSKAVPEFPRCSKRTRVSVTPNPPRRRIY